MSHFKQLHVISRATLNISERPICKCKDHLFFFLHFQRKLKLFFTLLDTLRPQEGTWDHSGESELCISLIVPPCGEMSDRGSIAFC